MPLQGGGRLQPGQARKGGRRRTQGQQPEREADVTRRGNSPAPARGYRTRLALPPARAAPPAVGVAAPW
ncbi:hypothetical protein BHM03_00036986 [Ensete ventricosum]|uniref:Uncharacterized protein n=1 Tax=Ensete ventricosum TaxID=4639 RepID=A0A445MJJ9_ENSVE|nr:hypothetical protein BHM03_00036986 [Ensete ventricosum]